jgi:hypothetical protein
MMARQKKFKEAFEFALNS